MACLWLTLADPKPATNGQFLYSEGLIGALAQTGSKIRVIGLSRPESLRRGSDDCMMSWRLAENVPVSRWAGLVSPLPQVALRSRTAGMRRLLSDALAVGQWEAIVFDSIAIGWALPAVLAYRDRQRHRPALVYLSHNHERRVAAQIAAWDRVAATRLLKRLDAMKVAWLERRLVREADLVTANTPEDAARFARERPDRPVLVLPPGYGGARRLSRRIDAAVPRRAIVVGSFDWLPKRVSLESFLAVAAPVFARAGIALQIVGQAEAVYLAWLRVRFPTVDFTGAVPAVIPYMDQARMALVPDMLGGFKLKGLDYVFNRLPILAMKGAVPGMPMRHGAGIREYDSHAGLAEAVVVMMDDLPALNEMQETAYAACAAQFDWSAIGRSLAGGIAAAGSRHCTRPVVGYAAQRAG